VSQIRGASWRSLALLATLILLAASNSWTALAQETDAPRSLSPQIAVFPGWTILFGQSLVLDASRSTHDVPAESIDEIRYTWTLGDGTALVGEQIAHSFSAPGTYDIELRMEIFETNGIFHRAVDRRQVTVTLAEIPTLVGVIDLETGFALPGGTYAAIIQIQDEYLLLDPAGTTPILGEVGQPMEPVREALGLAEPSWLVGASGFSIDRILVLSAVLAWELDAEPWLVTVGLGSSTRGMSVPLTPSLPAVAQSGDRLSAEIERVSLATLGIGYHATDRFCLLGSLGVLNVVGAFDGSSRVEVDGEPLPRHFSAFMPTLSFGAGIRLDWLLLSTQLLLLL